MLGEGSCLELVKALHGGLHQVDGVAAAQGFGYYVSYPCGLHDRAHSAPGDQADAGSGWLQQYQRCPKLGVDGMGDGASL